MAQMVSIAAVTLLRNELYEQRAVIEARITKRELEYEVYRTNYESERERDAEMLNRMDGGIGAVERIIYAAQATTVTVEQAYGPYESDHAH